MLMLKYWVRKKDDTDFLKTDKTSHIKKDWNFTSIQAGVSGTRLTFPPKRDKTLYKIYETMDSRHWTRGSAGQSPWERRHPWEWVFDCPSFLSGEFSGFGAGRGTQVAPGSPKLKRQNKSLWSRDNQSSQGRVPEERGPPREKALQICLAHAFSWELIRACVWGDYMSLGKSCPKGAGDTTSRAHTT